LGVDTAKLGEKTHLELVSHGDRFSIVDALGVVRYVGGNRLRQAVTEGTAGMLHGVV